MSTRQIFPPILLSIFCSTLCGISLLHAGSLSIVLLIAIVLMAFNFTDPYRGIYIYLFILPFCPECNIFATKGLGTYSFVKLLNILFLVPIVLKYIVEGKIFSDNSRKYFIFDLLVMSFLILSSLYYFINFGFKEGKSILYSDIIDFYLIYFVITRFITKNELFVTSIEILIYSALFLCAFGILDYFADYGFYSRMLIKLFPHANTSAFGLQEVTRGSFARIQISFSQPLSLGIYLSIIHVLILSTYKNTFNAYKKIAYLSAFLLGFFCLILAQARGPFVIDCMLITTILFLRKAKKIFLFLILFFFLLYGLMYSGFSSKIVEDFSYENIQRGGSNVYFRIELYENFFSKLNKLSWVGENRELYNSLPMRLQLDTVAWYIQILATNGFITFFIFILLIAKVLWSGTITCLRYREKYMYGCFLALTCLLLCYSGISFIGLSKFYFWVIFSLCIGIVSYSRKHLPHIIEPYKIESL